MLIVRRLVTVAMRCIRWLNKKIACCFPPGRLVGLPAKPAREW